MSHTATKETRAQRKERHKKSEKLFDAAAQDALAKEIAHGVLKFINNHDGMELTYK